MQNNCAPIINTKLIRLINQVPQFKFTKNRANFLFEMKKKKYTIGTYIKISIKSIQVYIVFIVCLLFVQSCSEKDVISGNETYLFDSARYNWTADTLQGVFITQLLVLDTNQVFLTDNNNLIHFDGTHYTFYNTNGEGFSGHILAGLDGSHIYVGGEIPQLLNGRYFGKPAVKRWNGSSFELIKLPTFETISDAVRSIYPRTSSEIWFGTVKGKVFRYDGQTNFENYRFVDTSFTISNMVAINGELFAVATKVFHDTLGLNDSTTLAIFKYDGLDWSKAYFKSFHQSDSLFYAVRIVNKNIYAIKENDGILKFNGTDFIKIVNISQFEISPSAEMGGNLPLNFIVANRDHKLYNWNGNKWSRELEDNNVLFWKIEQCNGAYFCLSEFNVSGNIFFLYKGIHKD